MKYTFVKLHDTHYNLKYSWILKCTDIDTLSEHNKKYMGSIIESGIKDWFSVNKKSVILKNGYRYTPHTSSDWSSAISSLMSFNEKNFLETSIKLENDIIQGKIKHLFRNGILYLRENGSYMIQSNSLKVIEEIEMSTMIYPEYSKEDIRIVQWDGGTHFYAKLGNMDVVDEDGNQKWDTHDEAYKEALNYLKD